MAKSSPLVLLADDELHICKVMGRILEKEGYVGSGIRDTDGKGKLGRVSLPFP